jgi:Uncharacterized protein conserved in archaea
MEVKNINFAAMPQTAVQVVTAPTEFFKSMPKTGGFLEPLVFAVIMGFIAGIVHAILSPFGVGYGTGYGRGMMSGFGMIIFMPIAAVIGSFIGAAIIFVIWKLMGSQENYETSYRCTAYLVVLAPVFVILRIIPYAGIIVYMAIYVYFIVIASTQVHNIPAQKAWMVFGIIGVVLTMLSLYGEYTARHMAGERWRTTTEETAKQYQKYREEAKKQAEEARQQAEHNR